MRLVIVSCLVKSGWGGSELLWRDVANLALERGHEVTVSFPAADQMPKPVEAVRRGGAVVCPQGRDEQSLIHRIGRRIGAWTGKRYKSAFELPADCMMVSLPSAVSIWGQPELLDRLLSTDTPYVLLVQHNQEGWMCPPGLRDKAAAAFERARGRLFVSDMNRRLLERQLGVRLTDYCIVDNPVGLSESIRLTGVGDPPSASSGALKMACVARFDVSIKGQDMLLEALGDSGDGAGGPGVWHERDWRLSFVGKGPGEAYMRRLVALYGLEERIDFVGHVDGIETIWKSHHALVLPSRSEGTSLAMLEAMCCGRAALVTAVGDSGLWVSEGRTGVVAEGVSVEGIRGALERLWESRGRLAEMGRIAREDMLERHDAASGERILKMIEGEDLSESREVLGEGGA